MSESDKVPTRVGLWEKLKYSWVVLRYKVMLWQHMNKLGRLCREFYDAMNQMPAYPEFDFLFGARRLYKQLAGEPGSGALEVLEQLEQDIKATESFLDRWRAKPTEPTWPMNEPKVDHRVLRSVSGIHHELSRLRARIDKAPPTILDKIKEDLTELRKTQPDRPPPAG
jgi:hypothetical protein